MRDNIINMEEKNKSQSRSRLTPVFMSLTIIVAIAWTPSTAAFVSIDTKRPLQTKGNILRHEINHSRQAVHNPPVRRRTFNFNHLFTRLQMATKSGGRPITSVEQFQQDVLGSDKDDKDDTQSIAKPILVYYSAPWCGPCRLSNPIVKHIIKNFVPKIDVVDIDTDALPELAESTGVTSIPTIEIYYKGEVLDMIVGCVSKNVLSRAVQKILEDFNLDIDDINEGSGMDDKDT